MAKVNVRLTIRPDEPFEVEEHEIPGLRHQGLLIEEPGVPASTLPAGTKAGKTDKEGA